jgi:thioredoxin reductase
MNYDVVIVGGGPAGLSAALTLGRARKRVLLCDAGSPRNIAAAHVQGFVTRDGIAPAEFRRIGREELATYPNVAVRAVRVDGISGERNAFDVRLETESVRARRVLLCTGMIDELPSLDGFREIWGTSIFQCPYCHGWEHQNQKFGFMATGVDALPFALLLRGWTREVTVLTNGKFAVPPETGAQLAAGGVLLEERSIARLASTSGRLERVEFSEGDPLRLDVLFARPTQRHAEVVATLGLTLDPMGLVKVDEMHRETSRAGIYAAGDLVTVAQSAVFAASSGMHAAAMLNHALTSELATTGELP